MAKHMDRRAEAGILTRLVGVTLAAVLGAGLAGCGAAGGPRSGDTTDSTTEETAMLTDADEVLALAGLSLPDGADGATVETTDRPGYRYAYTVTFDAAEDEVAQFAEDMTGAALSELSVPPAGEPDVLYQDTTISDVPAGSRYWDGSFSPDGGGYGKLLLLVDGPDLTRVHVGVAAFDS